MTSIILQVRTKKSFVVNGQFEINRTSIEVIKIKVCQVKMGMIKKLIKLATFLSVLMLNKEVV